MKPRIFLGSSGQQERLIQALTRGLQDIADVDAWTTVFNPGVSTLARLVELTHEVDFAAFVFAQDDWTAKGASPEAASGQASPRDNVVFEAGLFGGALGIRRTFILHANGAKLPTDLLGLTSIRYDPATTPAVVRQINEKLRKAIEAEGRISRLEGDWWQLSLTARTEFEPSALPAELVVALVRLGDVVVLVGAHEDEERGAVEIDLRLFLPALARGEGGGADRQRPVCELAFLDVQQGRRRAGVRVALVLE